MCALIDRRTRLVKPCCSLVLQALVAPFRRLPLTTFSRESCLCIWRLIRLWTDTWIFLHLCTQSDLNLSFQHNNTSTVQSMNLHRFRHLCIFGICRWEVFSSIKDLSWSALPLQNDWNVHNSVCECPRVSIFSGSLAFVFVLHDLRDFNRGGR